MMKQINSIQYDTPELEVHEVESKTVLCASNDQGGAGTFEEVTW